MTGLTMEEFNERYNNGFTRFVVYCKNDAGHIFFVRDQATIDESPFTSDLARAHFQYYGSALNLRDFMEEIYSHDGTEFYVMKVNMMLEWDY